MVTVKFIPNDGSEGLVFEIAVIPIEGHIVLLDNKEFTVGKVVHDVANRMVNVHLLVPCPACGNSMQSIVGKTPLS